MKQTSFRNQNSKLNSTSPIQNHNKDNSSQPGLPSVNNLVQEDNANMVDQKQSVSARKSAEKLEAEIRRKKFEQ